MAEAVDGRVTIRWRNGSIELAYREWSGDGGPIVLLHGLSSSSRIWDQVAARLAPRWRVVALDQRGHGRSDKPDRGYDFATIVADDRAALAALGAERPLLVGHSWGGNVALQWAVEPGPAPRGLVLVDGGFLDPSRRMTWAEAERTKLGAYLKQSMACTVHATFALLYATAGLPSEARAAICEAGGPGCIDYRLVVREPAKRLRVALDFGFFS